MRCSCAWTFRNSDSQILANAFGGPGGNITMFADTYLTSGSVVDASSARNTPGTVNVNARITDLSGSVTQLPGDTLQAANLLRSQCQARAAEGKLSSLVVSGREGIPPQPDRLLSSPLESIAGAAVLAPQADRGPLYQVLAGVWQNSDCTR